MDVERVDQEETTRTSRFSVANTGIAIPHDKINGLSDKFTRDVVARWAPIAEVA